MEDSMVVQGRVTTENDIHLINSLMNSNPGWNRTRLSKELCRRWDWMDANGQMKDIAARTFLCKLERRGLITLPPRQYEHLWGARLKKEYRPPLILHSTEPIIADLRDLKPVTVKRLREPHDLSLFKCFISEYHYLPYRTVGKNMSYMAYDRHQRPLSVLLFGSAAWRCTPRDKLIGWSGEKRRRNINLITNNTRFLILPWVQVPNLASHILSKVAGRISTDWMDRYNHPVYMLETFVERDRFRGTSYRAANWMWVGKTKGRSRNDRYRNIKVPEKDIYVYPLRKNFREALCN